MIKPLDCTGNQLSLIIELESPVRAITETQGQGKLLKPPFTGVEKSTWIRLSAVLMTTKKKAR